MLFHEMTAHALRNVDRENTLVILPIAACEQHGPHLPTGTDTIICTAVAEAVVAQLAAYAWPGNVRQLENCIEGMIASKLAALEANREAGDWMNVEDTGKDLKKAVKKVADLPWLKLDKGSANALGRCHRQ